MPADAPEDFSAWDRLGDLEVSRGRFADAARHYARATQLRPDDPAALFKWARACFDDSQLDEAGRLLRKAARLAPNHEAILRLQAQIFSRQSNWPAVAQTARAWATANPKNAQAWRALAHAEIEIGYLQQAIRSFRRSIELGARDAGSLATFGRLCLTAMEFGQAARALDEAEAFGPPSADLLTTRAALAMYSGRSAEGETYCRRALAVNADDATAFSLLAQLTKGRLPDEEFAALNALAGRSDLTQDGAIKAAFALAECLDARDQTALAFAAWERANRLCVERSAAAGFAYDAGGRVRQIDELISLFPGSPAPSDVTRMPRPVFVLGMPRSGTTLVESVIGAHQDVFACGERAAMRFIMQEFLPIAREQGMALIPERAFAYWRDYYWKELPETGSASVVTDKNPWNFDAVGMILRILPEARIVHVRRNPVDTGFSIYRNEFTKFAGFAHRLEDIAHYYNEYARLMAHWESIAGDRLLTIQYEDFVRDFDTAGPALLAHCGLEWQESCREFWKSTRVINSMSTLQVREPLAKQANRAGRYADELRPLAASLEKYGVNPETGARLP